MIEIPKSELIPLIIGHYSRQLQESAFHIYTLQQKYHCSLSDFEEKVKSQSEEDFQSWDDYINWKGHEKSAAYLLERIKKIEDGLFEIA